MSSYFDLTDTVNIKCLKPLIGATITGISTRLTNLETFQTVTNSAIGGYETRLDGNDTRLTNLETYDSTNTTNINTLITKNQWTTSDASNTYFSKYIQADNFKTDS